MALQGSGAITLAQIAAEFGGAAPHAISEYYRGGIYVPDITANLGIPTAGEISLSDFYGAQAAITVTVTEAQRSYTAIGACNAYGYVAANKAINFNTNDFATMAAAGSRTPTTLNGATIQGLYWAVGNGSDIGYFFVVVLSGIRAKSFFSTIAVQGMSTYNSSAADFWTGASSSVWKFTTAASGYATYGGWDGTGTRTVTFT